MRCPRLLRAGHLEESARPLTKQRRTQLRSDAHHYDPTITAPITTSLLKPLKAGKRAAWRYMDQRRWARADPRFAASWPAIDSVEGWLSQREARLLFTLAGLVPSGSAIVEIGCYKGRSTTALASGARAGVPIYGVDPHTGCRVEVEAGIVVDTWPEFRENLARTGSTAVVPVRATSVEAAQSYDGAPVALLFIDGWHSADAVIADYSSWKPHCVPEPVVVFDDMWHPDVLRGIKVLAGQLPQHIGTVGKDGVFADGVPRHVRTLIARG